MQSEFRKYIFITIIGFIFQVCASFGQNNNSLLKGKIMNVNGAPVQDVSVSIEGSAVHPVLSDENGEFEIQRPEKAAYLLISPAKDYHPKRIFLDNTENIIVYLTPLDMESMDEKINVLLTSKNKRNMITSFRSIDPQDYLYLPYETVDQFFQGNVAAMHTTNHSGMPGSGTSGSIRGIKSLNTNNQPLYVVDGIPMETFGLYQSEIRGYEYNPLTSIEPQDISDITIVKDNCLKTIMGVRGSNGVVLIETLKPTELKTTIDFSYRTGIKIKPERLFPQMEAGQYKTYANEVLLSSKTPEEHFPELYPALFSNEYTDDYYRYMHNTDWQELIFQNGIMNEVHLRMKGGDEIARYGLSVGYMKKNGVVKSTDYERLNIRLVGTFNIFKWLRIFISTHLNSNSANLLESALSTQTSPIYTSMAKSPMMIPYSFDKKGNQLKVLDDIGSLSVSNPYSIFENFKGINRNNRSLSSIKLEGDLSKQLKLNSLFGINLNTLSEDVFMPNYGMSYYYDGTAYNVSKKVKNFLYAVYFDNSISYSPITSYNHNISMDLGFRMNMNRYELDIGISKNSHENDEYESIQNGVFYLKEIDGRTGYWNRLSIYYNLNYSYKNKYLLNLAVSTENSTRFGKNSDLNKIGNIPFATFYCIGTGWRLSSENFLRHHSWIEELKFRLSYGISGNDDIGNMNAFNYLQLDHYRETTGVTPGNRTSGALKNESYHELNAGMDLSLWGNRFNVTANYFNIKTYDMFIYEPVAYYTGFNHIPKNSGSVNTSGIEISSGLRLVNKNRFKWDIGINISPWQKSEVLDIRNDKLVTRFPGGEIVTRTGGALIEYYGYQYEGVLKSAEEAETYKRVNNKGIPYISGDARFTDFSGPEGRPDSIINEYDKVSLGSPFPDIYGGISNSFRYGRWSLNIGIHFVSGNELFNYLRYENEKMTGLSNQSKTVLNRWVHEGHETDVPRALWEDPVGNSAFSSRWIEDGSYLRIKNITLAYTIPEKFLAFRNIKTYVTLHNPFTFTNYLGYDPEFSSSFRSIKRGVDYGLMPQTRSIIGGIVIGL